MVSPSGRCGEARGCVRFDERGPGRAVACRADYLSRFGIDGARSFEEARIGQLLGAAKHGSHHSVTTEGAKRLSRHDRHDFRIMAAATWGEAFTMLCKVSGADAGGAGGRPSKGNRATVAQLAEQLGVPYSTARHRMALAKLKAVILLLDMRAE